MPDVQFWLEENMRGVGLKASIPNPSSPFSRNKWLFTFSENGRILPHHRAQVGGLFNTNGRGKIIVENFPEEYIHNTPNGISAPMPETVDSFSLWLDTLSLVFKKVLRVTCKLDSEKVEENLLYMEPLENSFLVMLRSQLREPYRTFFETFSGGKPFVRY